MTAGNPGWLQLLCKEAAPQTGRAVNPSRPRPRSRPRFVFSVEDEEEDEDEKLICLQRILILKDSSTRGLAGRAPNFVV